MHESSFIDCPVCGVGWSCIEQLQLSVLNFVVLAALIKKGLYISMKKVSTVYLL